MTNAIISARHSVMAFDSDSFVRNFVKYLMSTSRNHGETAKTKRNLIVEYAEDGPKPKTSKVYYNDDAKARARDLLKRWDARPRPHQVLIQDLTYLSFIVPIGRRAVSNFLTAQHAAGQVFIDIHDPHAASWCLEDRFAGDQSRFERSIGQVIDQVDELVTYDSLDRRDQIEVDKILHRHVNRSWPDHPPILAASHNDQDAPFHIHRILLRG